MTTARSWSPILILACWAALASPSAAAAAPGNDAYCVSGNCLDGYGVWRRARDNTYEGEWKNGRFHGRGTRIQRSDRYEGEWSEGRWQGQGVHVTRQGRYEGSFLAGRRDGWGEFRDARTGATYQGQWSEDQPEGWGRRVDARGSVYEGGFRRGRREGWGRAEKVGGYVYVGQWRGDQYEGHGFWRTSSGDRYVGSFQGGQPHGRGMRTRANGDHYVGQYRQNKRHGQGVEITASGRVMRGRFDNGLFQGRPGRRSAASAAPAIGVTAIGCLTGDCSNGDGIAVMRDGRVLAGHWRGGQRTGFALDATLDGQTSASWWENGRAAGDALAWARRQSTSPASLAEAAAPSAGGCTEGDCNAGRGRYVWQDGRRYEGTFREGRPHGMGRMQRPDGSVYLGEWVDGSPEGRGTLTDREGHTRDGYWKRGRYAGAQAPAAPAVPFGEGETRAAQPAPNSFGRFRALLIANSRYADARLEDLVTPDRDVDALGDLLEESYGFETTRLRDATRAEIVSALSTLRRDLESDDNLVVYYAGHGWLDEKTDEGYWLPVDASMDDQSQWLSNATVATSLRGIDAHHILVIADSCFSGTLTRGVRPTSGSNDARRWSELLRLRSRVSLTSGGIEPVLDGGGGGHSVFARALLTSLRANRRILDGTSLFQRIREQVSLDAAQMPTFGNIRRAGHEVGGDFVFVRSDAPGGAAAKAGR